MKELGISLEGNSWSLGDGNRRIEKTDKKVCNNQHKIWLGEWMNYFVRQRYKQDDKIQKKLLDSSETQE